MQTVTLRIYFFDALFGVFEAISSITICSNSLIFFRNSVGKSAWINVTNYKEFKYVMMLNDLLQIL